MAVQRISVGDVLPYPTGRVVGDDADAVADLTDAIRTLWATARPSREVKRSRRTAEYARVLDGIRADWEQPARTTDADGTSGRTRWLRIVEESTPATRAAWLRPELDPDAPGADPRRSAERPDDAGPWPEPFASDTSWVAWSEHWLSVRERHTWLRQDTWLVRLVFTLSQLLRVGDGRPRPLRWIRTGYLPPERFDLHARTARRAAELHQQATAAAAEHARRRAVPALRPDLMAREQAELLDEGPQLVGRALELGVTQEEWDEARRRGAVLNRFGVRFPEAPSDALTVVGLTGRLDAASLRGLLDSATVMGLLGTPEGLRALDRALKELLAVIDQKDWLVADEHLVIRGGVLGVSIAALASGMLIRRFAPNPDEPRSSPSSPDLAADPNDVDGELALLGLTEQEPTLIPWKEVGTSSADRGIQLRVIREPHVINDGGALDFQRSAQRLASILSAQAGPGGSCLPLDWEPSKGLFDLALQIDRNETFADCLDSFEEIHRRIAEGDAVGLADAICSAGAALQAFTFLIVWVPEFRTAVARETVAGFDLGNAEHGGVSWKSHGPTGLWNAEHPFWDRFRQSYIGSLDLLFERVVQSRRAGEHLDRDGSRFRQAYNECLRLETATWGPAELQVEPQVGPHYWIECIESPSGSEQHRFLTHRRLSTASARVFADAAESARRGTPHLPEDLRAEIAHAEESTRRALSITAGDWATARADAGILTVASIHRQRKDINVVFLMHLETSLTIARFNGSTQHVSTTRIPWRRVRAVETNGDPESEFLVEVLDPEGGRLGAISERRTDRPPEARYDLEVRSLGKPFSYAKAFDLFSSWTGLGADDAERRFALFAYGTETESEVPLRGAPYITAKRAWSAAIDANFHAPDVARIRHADGVQRRGDSYGGPVPTEATDAEGVNTWRRVAQIRLFDYESEPVDPRSVGEDLENFVAAARARITEKLLTESDLASALRHVRDRAFSEAGVHPRDGERSVDGGRVATLTERPGPFLESGPPGSEPHDAVLSFTTVAATDAGIVTRRTVWDVIAGPDPAAGGYRSEGADLIPWRTISRVHLSEVPGGPPELEISLHSGARTVIPLIDETAAVRADLGAEAPVGSASAREAVERIVEWAALRLAALGDPAGELEEAIGRAQNQARIDSGAAADDWADALTSGRVVTVAHAVGPTVEVAGQRIAERMRITTAAATDAGLVTHSTTWETMRGPDPRHGGYAQGEAEFVPWRQVSSIRRTATMVTIETVTGRTIRIDIADAPRVDADDPGRGDDVGEMMSDTETIARGVTLFVEAAQRTVKSAG